jgi:F-type H+-transporting ATPase subunit b
MAVDWFTVAAQLVNFIILVVLLQRYLYRPILSAMDDREKLVSARFAESAQAREQAEQEKKSWTEKASAVEAERVAVLEHARVEAEAEKSTLQQAADEEAKARAERWRATQAGVEADFTRELERRAQFEAILMARELIPAFTGADLETRAIELFLAQLEALPREERARLHEGLMVGPVLVFTATALGDGARKELARALAAEYSPSPLAAFEVNAALLCGVELVAGDWKLCWSIGDYLSNLESKVSLPNPQEAKIHGE